MVKLKVAVALDDYTLRVVKFHVNKSVALGTHIESHYGMEIYGDYLIFCTKNKLKLWNYEKSRIKNCFCGFNIEISFLLKLTWFHQYK